MTNESCFSQESGAKSVPSQRAPEDRPVPLWQRPILFVFGSFTLYEGRTSYNLNQVSVTHHFAELAQAQPGIYYGYYFLELADYFGREGTDEREMMNLLYVTVKALLNSRIDNRLIRCVYELRTMAEQGMMPEVTQCAECAEELSCPGEGIFLFAGQPWRPVPVLCIKNSGCTADFLRGFTPCSISAWHRWGKLYTFRGVPGGAWRNWSIIFLCIQQEIRTEGSRVCRFWR